MFAIEDEYSCERATLELDDGAAADPDSTSESESLSMFIKSTKSHGNLKFCAEAKIRGFRIRGPC